MLTETMKMLLSRSSESLWYRRRNTNRSVASVQPEYVWLLINVLCKITSCADAKLPELRLGTEIQD